MVRSFLGNVIRSTLHDQARHGDDIRRCIDPWDIAMKRGLYQRIVWPVIGPLTHEEPQLHVQPGAARRKSVQKGERVESRLPIAARCGELVLERPSCLQ